MNYLSPFEYNGIVTGMRFVGRENEVSRVQKLISAHKNVLLYGPPKIGKRSIVHNALKGMDLEGEGIVVCKLDLFNIRHVDKLMFRLAKGVSAALLEPQEQQKAYSTFLKNIPMETSPKQSLTDKQIKLLLKFPQSLAHSRKKHLVLYFQQFQDILLFDKPIKILGMLESAFADAKDVSLIIIGDKRNAMYSIFEEMHFFRNVVTEVPIKFINRKVFAEFIVKCFAQGGKEASLKDALTIYDILEGDPWYAQHLAEICYLLTDTVLDQEIIQRGVKHLLSMYDYELHNTIYGLSNHQLQLLRAILDGERRFSKTEVLEKYGLNSSANVNRLKEALTKKEIVTFVSKNTIDFNDSLLKLWFRNYFFNDQY